MQQRPEVMGSFMRYMTVQHYGKADWLTLFPLEKELATWTNSQEKAVFVDVGGGMGHQCVVLKQRYPQLQGRVVLQDLPEVIPHAQLPPGIEKAAINFLENQPEKGTAILCFMIHTDQGYRGKILLPSQHLARLAGQGCLDYSQEYP